MKFETKSYSYAANGDFFSLHDQNTVLLSLKVLKIFQRRASTFFPKPQVSAVTNIVAILSPFATLYFQFHWEIAIKIFNAAHIYHRWPICIMPKSPDGEFHRASTAHTRGSVKSVTDLKRHTITHIKLAHRWNRIWVSDDILSSYTVEELSLLHNFHYLRSFTYQVFRLLALWFQCKIAQ